MTVNGNKSIVNGTVDGVAEDMAHLFFSGVHNSQGDMKEKDSEISKLKLANDNLSLRLETLYQELQNSKMRNEKLAAKLSSEKFKVASLQKKLAEIQEPHNIQKENKLPRQVPERRSSEVKLPSAHPKAKQTLQTYPTSYYDDDITVMKAHRQKRKSLDESLLSKPRHGKVDVIPSSKRSVGSAKGAPVSKSSLVKNAPIADKAGPRDVPGKRSSPSTSSAPAKSPAKSPVKAPVKPLKLRPGPLHKDSDQLLHRVLSQPSWVPGGQSHTVLDADHAAQIRKARQLFSDPPEDESEFLAALRAYKDKQYDRYCPPLGGLGPDFESERFRKEQSRNLLRQQYRPASPDAAS